MLKKYSILIVTVSISLVYQGCIPDNQKKVTTSSILESVEIYETKVDFATGFKVSYFDHYKKVKIPLPWQSADHGFEYLLVQRGAEVPEHDENVQVIEIPLDRIVCTSTSHLPALDMLGIPEKLIGFPHTDYISSSSIRKLIDQGGVTDIGMEAGINIEMLMELDPGVVIDFAMGNNYDKYKSITKAGIPLVINADYMEETPLGRAEWIKFMALFFNLEKKADSVFNEIKHNYDSLYSIASKINQLPTVYSGIVYGDVWYMPGGQNFGAKFLSDARGDYLWKTNDISGSLKLSFETVYEKANTADYWIGVGSYKSLKEIRESDERYASFSAFKNGNVYSYNAKVGEKGGSTFLELGYARPDIVLADLIKILHPQLLPDHNLYFYEKLR
ncbi:ABC transporter substrate-binding protein [Fulvivirgaceae bacterium BMA10]|uniref:ABC transporter substrate-binding protein n=1 Tax=Splendidivirga corallicola TaxID=3051826 RepID=A0ABT8KMS8_9BACT|nr:ABC transporter substrate-binding protein [Fulvivirgaceae bacterium BMA10]